MRRQSADTPLSAVLVISDLEFGGAQRQVVELANNMDPEACVIHVCSLSDFVPLGKAIHGSTSRLSLILRRFHFDFSVVPRLARLLRRLKADVVHSFLFDATIASRLAGSLVRSVAVVSSERNANYNLKRSNFIALKATERFSDLTIANSTAGAAFNSQLYRRQMSCYRVVHNGADIERFKPANADRVRKELGLGDRQPVVGMFASFKPQKNHAVWLRAARQVIQRVPNAKLLFVGDQLHKGMSNSTEFKKTIQLVVEEAGLTRHCLFVGNRPDVENYYNVCTVTVLPSLFEGTPNALLESMACGVPVVASNVADNTYLVQDGKTGFVVAPNDESALADRVCRILADNQLRNTMAEAARAWICSEFSCRRLAEKTLSAYRHAIAVRARR